MTVVTAQDLHSTAASVTPLSGADAFWLRMDSAVNLMMINGVMLFDERLDFERVRSLIAERLLAIPRFRQRIGRPAAGRRPYWESDPDFDLDRHVTREQLAAPGDQKALQDLVSRYLSTSLDPEHPRWAYHVVEGFGGGTALICRFHHSIGDGIALMMVLLSLADQSPEATADDNPFGAIFRDGPLDLESVRQRTAEVMPEGLKLMTRPVEIWRRIRPLVRGAASTAAFGRIAMRLNDRRTLFRNQVGVPKRAAWSEAVELSRIRTVGKSLGATINDVLTAAVAGGLRRYLLHREHPRGAVDFRATVPVNIRPLEEMAALGNQFGLVYLSLPVGVADPLDRLTEVQRRMGRLKRSAEPFVAFRILSLIGRLSDGMQRQLVRLFAAKASAVMTNVPGPRQTLYVAGSPLRDIFFWVPQSARLSMGISILSYDGNVRLGIATDEALVPDPESIIDGFVAEFETLERLAEARPSP